MNIFRHTTRSQSLTAAFYFNLSRTFAKRAGFVLLCSALLSGCALSNKSPLTAYQENNTVADTITLSQDATKYLPARAHTPVMTLAEQAVQFAALQKFHFSPWKMNSASLPKDEAFWATAAFTARTGYAENLLPWSEEAMNKLVATQSMDTYPSVAKPAIAVRTTNMRALPTIKPFFDNPALAGEGFPFDYFQNSSIHTGTPLIVTHVSTSGEWLFAETAFISGWVLASDVGFVSQKQIDRIMKGALYAIIDDDIPLKAKNNLFLSKGFVGTILSQATAADTTPSLKMISAADSNTAELNQYRKETVDNTEKNLSLIVPTRDVFGNTVLFDVPVTQGKAVKIPATLTPYAMATLANNVMGQRYSWGGQFEDRDCSATIRDLFTPFGIWLPRNSKPQVKKGAQLINLEGLSSNEKQHLIDQNGIPFFSLIGFKGHIGLYLGYEPGTNLPIMLHDIWGVKTNRYGRKGRAIVGKISITTLRPGEERWDVKKGGFFSKIRELQVLPGTWE